MLDKNRHDTHVSPVSKEKGADPDAIEKLCLHSNDDVAGFDSDAPGQTCFTTISFV